MPNTSSSFFVSHFYSPLAFWAAHGLKGSSRRPLVHPLEFYHVPGAALAQLPDVHLIFLTHALALSAKEEDDKKTCILQGFEHPNFR